MTKETPWQTCIRTGDPWTANLSPYTGCPHLALAPDHRRDGCKRCWLEALLGGPIA